MYPSTVKSPQLISISKQWKFLTSEKYENKQTIEDEPKTPELKNTLNISEWFAYRTIFITGGTGFIGKVLIEKLLRTCSKIDRIYLLIRYKHGKTPNERLTELVAEPIFNNLRESNPTIFDKLQVINGDLSLPNLKISKDDLQKLNKDVSVVFHCGAITDENESLKLSVTINTNGTKFLLRIVSQFIQLESFVFVSPLHAYHTENIIKERIVIPASPASKVAESITSFRNEHVEKLTKQILALHKRNSYHFSKILAEQIIAVEENYLPVCIVRAGLVTASVNEPYPGWIDRPDGLTNLIIAISKGSLRFYNYNPNYVADIVPVDIVVNCMISAAWYIGNNRSTTEKIFNCTTGKLNPITWNELNKLIPKYAREYPLDNTIWYPVSKLRRPSLLGRFYNYFTYKIPACLMDVGRILVGKKSCLFKSKDQHVNNDELVEHFQYYTTNQWISDNTNLLKLQMALNTNDQNLFNMNINSFKWEQYFANYMKGVRQFILKQDDATIAHAKSRLWQYYFFGTSWHILWIVLGIFVARNPLIMNLCKKYFTLLKDWYNSYNVPVPITDLSLLGAQIESLNN